MEAMRRRGAGFKSVPISSNVDRISCSVDDVTGLETHAVKAAHPKLRHSQSHCSRAQLGHLEAARRFLSLLDGIKENFNMDELVSLTAAQSWKTTTPLYAAAAASVFRKNRFASKHSNKVFETPESQRMKPNVGVFSTWSVPETSGGGRRDPNLWEWLQFSFTDYGVFYDLTRQSVVLGS